MSVVGIHCVFSVLGVFFSFSVFFCDLTAAIGVINNKRWNVFAWSVFCAVSPVVDSIAERGCQICLTESR